MATQKLSDSQWQDYFERISRAAMDKPVEVEVAGPRGGRHVEMRWLPLIGVTYDHKDDIIDIATDPLTDIIENPREVLLDMQDDGLHGMEVVDAEGNHEIIKLKEPLLISP